MVGVHTRMLQSFNHCYKCVKTVHFQKDCPGDGDEENIEPQQRLLEQLPIPWRLRLL